MILTSTSTNQRLVTHCHIWYICYTIYVIYVTYGKRGNSCLTMNPHRWGRGPRGSLILFDTHAFAPQRQPRGREMPSPSAFLLVSVNFTSPPGIPLPSTLLKPNPNSSHIVSQRHSIVALQCLWPISDWFRVVPLTRWYHVNSVYFHILLQTSSFCYHFVNKIKKWKKNEEVSGKQSSETTMCYNPPRNPRVGPGICQRTPLL